MSALDALRDRVRAWRVRRRRRKLLNAYSKVFKAKTGKSVGLTPLMAAYDMARDDGVMEFEDGEAVWHWPDGTEDVDGHYYATARWLE